MKSDSHLDKLSHCYFFEKIKTLYKVSFKSKRAHKLNAAFTCLEIRFKMFINQPQIDSFVNGLFVSFYRIISN